MNLRSILTTTFAAAVLMLTAANSHAAVTSFADIEYWVGTGDNQAAFVFDFNDGQDALVWGYQWDSATTATGEDMLTAIDASDDRLDTTLGSFDFLGDLKSYLISAQYDTRYGADAFPVPQSWFYYNGTAYNSLASSFVGMTDRVLSDGDWDVWALAFYDPTTYDVNHTFGDFAAAQAPSVGGPVTTNPVPEPASLSLLALGAVALTIGSRRRHA